MVELKTVISDPKTGKSYNIAIKGQFINSLFSKKIGDEIDGVFVSLPGYKLVLTGGSDKDGFPMRKDISCVERKRVLLASGVGFKSKHKGIRKRVSVHGGSVSPSIVQLNMKIKEWGPKPVEELVKAEEK